MKTYLRDGDRWLQKRKTRVIRHSRNPQYRQTIKYSSCDALGRNLLVMLWEKKQAFESNQGLGGAEVSLDHLPLTRLTVDWYPLFPIHTLGTHTADSPWWLREKWALEAGELDLRLSLLLKDENESVIKIISWWNLETLRFLQPSLFLLLSSLYTLIFSHYFFSINFPTGFPDTYIHYLRVNRIDDLALQNLDDCRACQCYGHDSMTGNLLMVKLDYGSSSKEQRA